MTGALPWLEAVNPFPPTAVAQVAREGDETITIATDAIRQASMELDAYLAGAGETSDASTHPGRVLAIVGDYGTGKTHLAVHLLSSASGRVEDRMEGVYLSAPSDSFVSLYRSFVVRLLERREMVRGRVQRFLADVIADSLQSPMFPDEVVQRLRTGTIDPVMLIKQLGLMESVYLEQVQQRLHEITDDAAFGTALTLLLRPGFEDAVWEWLMGREPDEILRERGITEAITRSESSALAAMGVFALLVGHHGNPFLVIVDELDQLLYVGREPGNEVQAAFKRMMTTFVAAGAFLVLIGLPDVLAVLRRDVRERISRVVRMSALTAQDAMYYIRGRQLAATGTDELLPFSEDAVSYLVDVADGLPRKIVSLCYHLYRRAAEQGSVITEPMVRAVAREQLYASGNDAMRREIRRVLTARGHSFTENRYVDTTPVDYWIPIGESGAAIALLVAPSILDHEQVEPVVAAAAVIRNAGDHEILLMVGGHLPARYAGELQDAVGREPLVYDPRGFADQLDAELRAMELRLERLTGGDPTATLLARVDRLGEQQSHALGLIMRLAGEIDTYATTSEQRLREVQRQVADVTSTVRPDGSTSSGYGPSALPDLPEKLARLFDGVLDLLEATRVESVLRRAYDDGPDAADARRVVRRFLRRPGTQLAAGVATLVEAHVRAFRSAVADWTAAVFHNTGRRPGPGDRESLDRTCQVFDAMLEYLPLYQLRELADLASSEQPQRDPRPIERIPEELAQLSTRVRAAATDPFEIGGTS